jgi:RNA polymerase sigma factor (TIGR02999 family)
MILKSSDDMSQQHRLNARALPGAGEITDALLRCGAGDVEARAKLVSLVYPELKRIASLRMRGERRDHTLQATALVSEFFLRLANQKAVQWRSRSHFLAVASQVMRQVLIDYARSHNALSHGGRCIKVEFTDISVPGGRNAVDILIFDELLVRLEKLDQRAAAVAEMRLFGELTHAEIAEIIGKDERTVKRYWRFARAWVVDQLQMGEQDVGGGMEPD